MYRLKRVPAEKCPEKHPLQPLDPEQIGPESGKAPADIAPQAARRPAGHHDDTNAQAAHLAC